MQKEISTMTEQEKHIYFMGEAIKEAKKGLAEGCIPIGSVLVVDDKIVGRGLNQRIQKASPTLHAEIHALENAGRLTYKQYSKSTLYTTLSPCDLCSGASLLFKIPTIVMAENKNFKGPEEYLQSRGVKLINLEIEECKQIMEDFIKKNPDLWNEDIGV